MTRHWQIQEAKNLPSGVAPRESIMTALILLLAACNRSTPTPAETSLLRTTFTHDQGGPPPDASGTPPVRHVSRVKVADGAAEIEVRLDVVQRPGGRYLYGVELVVLSSGEGAVTATVPPGVRPVNRGTAEEVLASLLLMVDWRQESWTSSTLRQTAIEIRADGTASAQ